jgi:hypothetical protein
VDSALSVVEWPSNDLVTMRSLIAVHTSSRVVRTVRSADETALGSRRSLQGGAQPLGAHHDGMPTLSAAVG